LRDGPFILPFYSVDVEPFPGITGVDTQRKKPPSGTVEPSSSREIKDPDGYGFLYDSLLLQRSHWVTIKEGNPGERDIGFDNDVARLGLRGGSRQ
jgi:hypothetical protein